MFRHVRKQLLTLIQQRELSGREYVVDKDSTVWMESVQHKLLECLIEVACDYIEWGRHRRDGKVMSRLERRYMFTPDFYSCEDPREWLEAHRESNDHNLIMFVLENYKDMESKKHEDKIIYILGALFHDYEFIFS